MVTSIVLGFLDLTPGSASGERAGPARRSWRSCIYFLSNTGMVSLVLALIEKQSVAKVWRQCYLWSFPYYLIGAGIAGAVTLSSRTVGWQTSALLILPLMYLVYSYYRLYLSRRLELD